MHRQLIALAALFVCASPVPVLAQNINIDFGSPRDCPSASYGGAGLPGVWNCIEGWHTSIANPQFLYQLVDVDGQPTNVTLHQYGGQDLLSANDPSVSGEDAILMNDAILTHFTILETCLFIEGLENGKYEVITYAWRPDHPSYVSRVRHDQSPQIIDVQGAWPGDHAEGVTYARHILQITNGVLGAHSGNIPGAEIGIGAAMNGIQLRKIEPLAPGDFNEDGAVDGIDLGILLSQWFSPGTADLNDDGLVNGVDLGILLANWTI